jgi:hypothetical protein
MDTEEEIYKPITVSVDFSRCVIDRDKYTTEFLLSFMIQNEGWDSTHCKINTGAETLRTDVNLSKRQMKNLLHSKKSER